MISEDEGLEEVSSAPAQLGAKRFVYAGYFAATAIGVTALLSSYEPRLDAPPVLWKPQIVQRSRTGRSSCRSPRLIGVGTAVVLLEATVARASYTPTQEVASELSKVTWPTSKENEVIGSWSAVVAIDHHHLRRLIFFDADGRGSDRLREPTW